MLSSAVVAIVGYCVANRWRVVAVGTLIAALAIAFDVNRFSITTDTQSLLSSDLPWRKRQMEFSEEFPQKQMLIVVDAPTSEAVEQAADQLVAALRQRPQIIRSVSQPGSGEFFRKNGLLFEPTPTVIRTTDGLTKGSFLVEVLASDPSLRGILSALSFVIEGLKEGKITLDQLDRPLSLAARALEDVLAGKSAQFSWRALLQTGAPQDKNDLIRFIEVEPMLDFSALQPGRAASDGVRLAARDLHLDSKFGATIKITGVAPLNDDQFSVLRESALHDTLAALLGTIVILWLALRSWKIVAAVFFSVAIGLTVTTAIGLALVGSFNLLSMAFFVLFVGLGVDFGIQFSVRYRAERYLSDSLEQALLQAAHGVAIPLCLAAAATATAFFSFVPTAYTGLSELGLIAGCGMLVAFLCSITIVPAALAILAPSGETSDVGFRWLAPVDDMLQRHRVGIIAATFIAVLLAVPLVLHLRFDLDPIDLLNQQAPAVVAFRQLESNPLTSGSDADIVLGSLAEADAAAKSLATLPEVSAVRTLTSLVPDDQPTKLAAIAATAKELSTAFAAKVLPAPSDADTVAALRSTAANLTKVTQGAGSEATRRMVSLLDDLAQASPEARARASDTFVAPLAYDLAWLKDGLSPQTVTIDDLPAALKNDFILSDGRARVQVLPKGSFSDAGVLQRFATTILDAFPTATGPAISLYESGRTVIDAFIKAGLIALVAIILLLLIVLRRASDVFLTVMPLLLAGVVTLELCGWIGIRINFANMIALPLLLGVGVAFKIYYVLAWRAGQTHLLETSLTRAIVFSAMTNAVAFGSMWLSSYPGMSSMGQMMALSLLCTMTAAVLFQPVLMGPPRQDGSAMRTS